MRSTTVFRGGIAEVTGDLARYKDEGFQIKLLPANATASGALTCTHKDALGNDVPDEDLQPGVYAGTVRFVVGSEKPPGEYSVVVCSNVAIQSDNAVSAKAAKKLQPIAIVGPLWVRALPLRITGVDPPVIKPQNEHYEFTVFGEGFNSKEADNAILIDTADGPILFADSRPNIYKPPQPCAEKPPERNGCAVRFTAAKDGAALTVSGIPVSGVAGRRRFRILAGHNVISNEAEVRFATSHDEIGVFSLRFGLSLGFLLIPVLVTLVLTKRIGQRPLGRWFVRAVKDEGAKRFSLSRLQLFAWMWTCLLGLFAGTFQLGGTLPAFPGGLFALAVLSIATSASSSVISLFRSSGGAAQVETAPSDLICDYGLVLWERVLFVGCTAASITYTAWLTITNVDSAGSYPLDIPLWLVLVSGICALVYISGKCVRSSGPQISQVFAEQGSLKLTITGANLSRDAYFELNGKPLSPQVIAVNLSGEHKAEVVSEQFGRPGHARVLRLVVPAPLRDWLSGATLSIHNPNGQQALCRYELAVAITSTRPEEVLPGSQFTITGHGFHDGVKVRIAHPSWDTARICEIAEIRWNTIDVLAAPDIEPGLYVLTVSNAHGTCASTNITVVARGANDNGQPAIT